MGSSNLRHSRITQVISTPVKFPARVALVQNIFRNTSFFRILYFCSLEIQHFAVRQQTTFLLFFSSVRLRSFNCCRNRQCRKVGTGYFGPGVFAPTFQSRFRFRPLNSAFKVCVREQSRVNLKETLSFFFFFLRESPEFL